MIEVAGCFIVAFGFCDATHVHGHIRRLFIFVPGQFFMNSGHFEKACFGSGIVASVYFEDAQDHQHLCILCGFAFGVFYFIQGVVINLFCLFVLALSSVETGLQQQRFGGFYPFAVESLMNFDAFVYGLIRFFISTKGKLHGAQGVEAEAQSFIAGREQTGDGDGGLEVFCRFFQFEIVHILRAALDVVKPHRIRNSEADAQGDQEHENGCHQ